MMRPTTIEASFGWRRSGQNDRHGGTGGSGRSIIWRNSPIFQLAKKYRLKTAWGTDILSNPTMTKHQGAILATMSRWYSNDEILTMATSSNAALLAMSCPRNPYPGRIGVIEADAYADILLVDGDPIADIKLIADPDANLKIIMKDGRIYKNTLTA
ncbi:MAG: hypothetical protein KK482_05985 [Sinorhizobium meliloti]|nr:MULTISPECIES: hypothetical protein [Sinorhizobium]MCG5483259.1 hypothetical protein [Sinorhizobium meliloti]RVQ02499.1 hypothetical protein CN070_08970 [Sinorhizobium meliloti]